MEQCDIIWTIGCGSRSDGGWGDRYIESAEVNGTEPLYMHDYDIGIMHEFSIVMN